MNERRFFPVDVQWLIGFVVDVKFNGATFATDTVSHFECIVLEGEGAMIVFLHLR
jgi:hypothetical protein